MSSIIVSFGAFVLLQFCATAIGVSLIPVSLNSTKLNVTVSIEALRNIPVFSFEHLQADPRTFSLKLTNLFEASKSVIGRYSRLDNTDLNFSTLAWSIMRPVYESAEIVSVRIVTQAPAPTAPFSTIATADAASPRFSTLSLLLTLNTFVFQSFGRRLLSLTLLIRSSALKFSMANITVSINNYRWNSTSTSAHLALVWRLTKTGDSQEDTSYLKNALEARSGVGYIRASRLAKSLDRSVSVGVSHVPKDDNPAHIIDVSGNWVAYSHFSDVLSHTYSCGVGEPSGRGGGGGGSTRKAVTAIVIIVGSCLVVAVTVFAFIWLNARRRRAASRAF